MLSLQAAYAAPLILLAQNRQDDRDRANLAQDRGQNAALIADAEYITREVASLRVALGEVVTRDFMRNELRALLEEFGAPNGDSGRDGDSGRGDRPGKGKRKREREKSAEQASAAAAQPDSSRREPPPDGLADTLVSMANPPSADAVQAALATVTDPEINRPITEIGMLKSVEIGTGSNAGRVEVGVYLTTAACPLRSEISSRVTQAVSAVEGVTDVSVVLDVMSDEQRTALRTQLRGNQPEREIPFARPESLTRVYGSRER